MNRSLWWNKWWLCFAGSHAVVMRTSCRCLSNPKSPRWYPNSAEYFCKTVSPYDGHKRRSLPSIGWDTQNLLPHISPTNNRWKHVEQESLSINKMFNNRKTFHLNTWVFSLKLLLLQLKTSWDFWVLTTKNSDRVRKVFSAFFPSEWGQNSNFINEEKMYVRDWMEKNIRIISTWFHAELKINSAAHKLCGW